jgi:hypothetical protein
MARTPSAIRDETLSALRQAIIDLKSPDRMLEVRKSSDAVRAQWADCLLNATAARDALEKAQLKEIRDKLMENDADLEKGTAALEAVLQKLTKLKQVLDTVARLVEITGRVVALL